MSRHRHLWEHNRIFDTSLSSASSDRETVLGTQSSTPKTETYGPGKMGCTYELCAGIVDKKLSLQQIAQEEVLEETGKFPSGSGMVLILSYMSGYNVPLVNLECITSLYSSVGHAGSHQTLYYCEVTDNMLEGGGGGVASEGEQIEVVYLPLEESLALLFDQEKTRPAGLCFAIMWFHQFKRPTMKS